ncbi:TSC22 domain family protein 2-like isoform X2 [Pimephales promelas]|uniref:TSC22 domain family protein 2-like isoform X2 n=1 Tax=Pimephales promelas TaxID=90988 RepID=UPI0019559009|nr:TSC22 domain family protein 2-like isoform X2 [Pimephales promelas]KAG1969194.1 TSC22 domain family protein [Pimephales promelas]
MSKMPAKKKSCFQITSVTQAQVAANSATDDTESLDDPDESRTEDVSSEIFDMSRTDYEPEVCDMSASEETLNNVCESEGQLPAAAPVNGGSVPRNNLGHQGIQASSAQTAGTSQVTNSSSVTTATSCSSRFRVIKLDHGTGEPFRRGRWTCMEYYEKDPDGSVMSRTVDSIRHTNVTEHLADRDSGLGATVGSVMAQVAPDAGSDGSSFTGPGSCSPETFSNKPVPLSTQQQVPGNSHVTVPHSLHPDGGHPGAHLQKSPSIPPPQLYQPQSSAHHLQSQPALISASQPEYTQRNVPTVTQTHPGASLSVGHAVSQGSSPVPMQVLGTVESPGVPGGVPLPVSSVPNLVQHVGLLSSISPISIQQSPVGQYQASGLSTPPQSTQNMPTAPGTVGGGGVPALSLLSALPGSATVPNLNTSAHSQVPRSGTAAGIGFSAMGFSQTDEPSQRMSDASAQIHRTDMMKPLITEGLQLSSPTVNSLFGISIPIDGEDDSASGASVVAIDNKIEQAMDLVKSHLMYAVREEVEVLKEQIKELFERNSVLERENAVLKSLANSEQLSQLAVQPNSNPSNSPSQLGPVPGQSQAQPQPYLQLDANTTLDSLPRQPQPNVTSA